MRIVIGLSALALLAACGQEDGVGGLTAEESQQLNEAAAMLDEAPDGFVPADETGLGNAAPEAETGELPVSGEGKGDER